MDFSFQPLFNCGIAYSKLNDRPNALDFLIQARKVKVERKHEIITQAIAAVDVSEKWRHDFPSVTVRDVTDQGIDCAL